MLLHDLAHNHVSLTHTCRLRDHLGAYQSREHLRRLHLIEAINVVLWQLKPKVCGELHQCLAIHLQSVDKTRRGFVQDDCGNSCKDLSICSLFAPPMRSSQKYDPDGGLADAVVPLLNPCLEQRLGYPTLD
jgi:hypothetical protein